MADSSENGLSTYLAEISRIPLLSASEEKRLARLALKGDKPARRKLIVSNLRLVVSIAKKYVYYGLPLQDLIEEGNIGLMKAVDRYDPERGCKFSTYATWWIRQAVTRSLSNHGRTIRIPVYITDNVAKYKKVAEEFYIKHGKQADVEDMMKAMDLSEKEILKLQAFADTIEPLDKLHSTDADGSRGIPEGLEPVSDNDAIMQMETEQQLQQLMGELSERETSIIRFRYGLDDGKAHTLEETGREFGLTRERIRQIEKDVMKRMRALAEEHGETTSR